MIATTVTTLAMALTAAAAALPCAMPSAGSSTSTAQDSSANTRDSIKSIVTEILDSMVAHDPYKLPLATVYQATENSHPAALGMMTAWRTITKVGDPSLLAIDTTNGTAYFALDVSEGNDAVQSILRARIRVVDQQLTEIELFINRNRGDHGFSFNATQLPVNYAALTPPANSTMASRETLWELSEALFAPSSNLTVDIADDCQFTEIGWKVVDTGLYGNGTTDPIACGWPEAHPYDANARIALVIDEELGFVVTSGIIPGIVYPYYGNTSAFIPNAMPEPQEAQEAWFENAQSGNLPLLSPTAATGDVLEVLQYYDGELKAMQINVYLSGPGMTSPWL